MNNELLKLAVKAIFNGAEVRQTAEEYGFPVWALVDALCRLR